MDSTTLATPEADPRDKKKFYFSDTRISFLISSRGGREPDCIAPATQAVPEEMRGVYTEVPEGFGAKR
jgi:hypothetical protein